MNRKRLFIMMGLLLCCSSEDENDNDEKKSACKEMVVALCTHACRCGEPDGVCMYYFETTNESFSGEADDNDGCVLSDTQFYCNGELNMDFDACAAGIEASTCGAYDGLQGLQLPSACSGLGGLEETNDGSGNNDEALCRTIVGQLCDANTTCVDSGYNFFTESGLHLYISGLVITSEECVGELSSICDSDLGIDYSSCGSVTGEAVCKEDIDGNLGVQVPEACKWITGDLS